MRDGRLLNVVVAGSLAALLTAAASSQHDEHAEPPDDRHDDSASRFPDEPMPLIPLDEFPKRPKPLLELGAPFLGTGALDPGVEMPGGAVWQPQLLMYGNYRSALQVFDDGEGRQITEWANRLDLFFNLQLTGTERVLYGVRPLDQDGTFGGYRFRPDEGTVNEFNWRTTTLFFEGDLGELIPDLDPDDTGTADWGFAVGRQPIVFQDGLLANDTVDGVALVRDSLFPQGGSDLKMTFFYAWDNIDRDDNRESGDNHMVAMFNEADIGISTWQADLIYIIDEDDGNDGVFWGLGATQRLGHLNTTFRAVGSYAIEDESAAVSSGHLLFGELSWTPHHTHDLVYVNGFWGIDEFSSAIRAPDAGGPLGRTGILFAAVGLGNYGAALGNRADNSAGAAIGYQRFFDHNRKQLIVEAGGRTATKGSSMTDFAVAARYQQAMGQHTILRFDVFGGIYESRDNGYGARVELQFKF